LPGEVALISPFIDKLMLLIKKVRLRSWGRERC
jgi:hypothetical protein